MRMSKSGLWMTLLTAVGVSALLTRWFKSQSPAPAGVPRHQKCDRRGREAMQIRRAAGTIMTRRSTSCFWRAIRRD